MRVPDIGKARREVPVSGAIEATVYDCSRWLRSLHKYRGRRSPSPFAVRCTWYRWSHEDRESSPSCWKGMASPAVLFIPLLQWNIWGCVGDDVSFVSVRGCARSLPACGDALVRRRYVDSHRARSVL